MQAFGRSHRWMLGLVCLPLATPCPGSPHPREPRKPPLLAPAMQKQRQPPAVEQTWAFWLVLAYPWYVFQGALWSYCWHQPQVCSTSAAACYVQFALPVPSCTFSSWLTHSSWHLNVLLRYQQVEIRVRTVVFNGMARKSQGRISNFGWYLYQLSSGVVRSLSRKGESDSSPQLCCSGAELACSFMMGVWRLLQGLSWNLFPSATAGLQHMRSEVDWRHWIACGNLHFTS